jgi:hypothetical protein
MDSMLDLWHLKHTPPATASSGPRRGSGRAAAVAEPAREQPWGKASRRNRTAAHRRHAAYQRLAAATETIGSGCRRAAERVQRRSGGRKQRRSRRERATGLRLGFWARRSMCSGRRLRRRPQGYWAIPTRLRLRASDGFAHATVASPAPYTPCC